MSSASLRQFSSPTPTTLLNNLPDVGADSDDDGDVLPDSIFDTGRIIPVWQNLSAAEIYRHLRHAKS
jgi:hypothetical protein